MTYLAQYNHPFENTVKPDTDTDTNKQNKFLYTTLMLHCFSKVYLYLTSFCMLILVPFFVVILIFSITAIVMAPVAWFCGWL